MGASSYSYQTVSVGSIAAWGYSLSGLAATTTYQWSAKTGCGTLASQYSDDISFTTPGNCTGVGNPAATNITTTTANIRWDASIPATYTQVRYAKDGTTSYRYVTLSANPGNTTLTGLLSGTKYNVWLRSGCSNGTTTAWSTPATFTTTIVRLSDNELDNLQLNVYPNQVICIFTYIC